MIYKIGRYLFKIAVRQFYAGLNFRGAPRVEKGPLLVVANHSNYFIDSLLVTTLYDRELWFLARSTLFKGGPLNWLLKQAHLVPVYRRQDDPGQMGRNEETFRFAIEKLSESRGLAIFPEGVSIGERKLSPIKTGAARIALQAEDAGNFKLGVKIQPAGITYTDFDQFRSAVTVTVGDPIEVSSYARDYQADAMETVRRLTADIENRLKQVTVEVSNASHADLIEKIAKIYQARGSAVDDRERMNLVVENVEELGPRYPERRAELEEKINEYIGMAAGLGLDEGRPLEPERGRLLSWLMLVPVGAGVALHYLPYQLVGRLARKLSDHPVSLGSYKLTTGILVFLAWHLIFGVLALLFSGSILLALAVILLLVLSGYCANNFLYLVRLHLLCSLWPGERNPRDVLTMMRDELIEELESLRVV